MFVVKNVTRRKLNFNFMARFNGLLERIDTTWKLCDFYHLYRAARRVTPDPLVELLPALNKKCMKSGLKSATA